MKLYHYHPQTKEYLSVSEAVKSPLEQDVYLIPSNATTLEPLEQQEDFAVCFDTEDGEWLYIDDHRGKTINNPDTREEKECDYLGALKQGFVLGTYVKTLEDLKNDKLQALSQFDKATLDQFFLNGTTLWIDRDLRGVFLGQMIPSAELLGLQTLPVSTDDGSIELELPIQTLKGLLAKLENYSRLCRNQVVAHRKNILALTTKEELDSYDFTTGYPDKESFEL